MQSQSEIQLGQKPHMLVMSGGEGYIDFRLGLYFTSNIYLKSHYCATILINVMLALYNFQNVYILSIYNIFDFVFILMTYCVPIAAK